MAKEELRTIRIEASSLRSAIDQLDEVSAQSDGGGGGAEARADSRFSYRVRALTVEFANQSSGWTKYVIPSRNLSRTGCSLLTGHYVYPGTACRVHLVTLQNHTQAVTGKIARCRYLAGTGRVYEVGVRFDSSIDVALFHRGANTHRILVVDDDPSVHRLLPHLLGGLNTVLKSALSADEALEITQNENFDVILLDVDMPGKDGLACLTELRARGWTRPVVALTAQSDDATQRRCLEAGFTKVGSKPLQKEAVTELIKSVVAEPIVSSLIHEKSMTRLIDAFVAELPAIVRELEQTYASQEHPKLEELARILKANAGSHGFDVISQAAGILEAAARDKKDAVELRRVLSDLTRLCHAARPITVVEQTAQRPSKANC